MRRGPFWVFYFGRTFCFQWLVCARVVSAITVAKVSGMVVTKTDGLLGNFLQEFSRRFAGKSVSSSLLPVVFFLGSCCTGVISLLRIHISWLSLLCPQNAITAVLEFLLCTCLLIFMSFPFPFVRFLEQFCFFHYPL